MTLAATSTEQHPSFVVVTPGQQSFLSDSPLENEEQATEDSHSTSKITPDVVAIGPTTQNNTASRQRQRQLQSSSLSDDETLKRMDVILNTRLQGITLEEYFKVWNEDTETSLYRNWLESTGKKDIIIQQWNICTDGDHNTNNNNNNNNCWKDDESYPMQRIVTFTVARTSHLYIGPPTAAVRHIQQCRVDQDTNRCVVTMQIDMQGIPFGDCFQVHIRWVATQAQAQQDATALDIQVGLYVHFIKSTIFSGKIRSSTREETRKAQLSLFHAIQQHANESTTVDRVVEKRGEECMNDETIRNNQNNSTSMDNEDGDDENDYDNENPSCFSLSNVCAGLFRNRHEDDAAAK